MYADQHLHTSFSGDSETPPEEQAEKAIALGMERICFTDHHDHDVVSDIDLSWIYHGIWLRCRSLKRNIRAGWISAQALSLGCKAILRIIFTS